MFGRDLGLTGAPDSPPILVRVAVDGTRLGPEALEAPDIVLIFRGGENSIAEPGRGRDGSMAEPGREIAARCALMVSLIDGGLDPIVLFENPMPGRAAFTSVRLGVCGLFGSFSRSFCAVGSRVSMRLESRVSKVTSLLSMDH